MNFWDSSAAAKKRRACAVTYEPQFTPSETVECLLGLLTRRPDGFPSEALPFCCTPVALRFVEKLSHVCAQPPELAARLAIAAQFTICPQTHPPC
jgi:hypothetical protein